MVRVGDLPDHVMEGMEVLVRRMINDLYTLVEDGYSVEAILNGCIHTHAFFLCDHMDLSDRHVKEASEVMGEHLRSSIVKLAEGYKKENPKKDGS